MVATVRYSKPALLIDVLRGADCGRPGQRTLVFCHSANGVRFVEKYIREAYNLPPALAPSTPALTGAAAAEAKKGGGKKEEQEEAVVHVDYDDDTDGDDDDDDGDSDDHDDYDDDSERGKTHGRGAAAAFERLQMPLVASVRLGSLACGAATGCEWVADGAT